MPAFACTPDAFPDLMAAAIERRDLTEWAEKYQAAADGIAKRREHGMADTGGSLITAFDYVRAGWPAGSAG